MKTKLSATLCIAATIFTFSITDVKAEDVDTAWDYNRTVTQTSGAFTYHAVTSQDEKEAWIYRIEVDKNAEHSRLEIPGMLENKSVTRIGYLAETDPAVEDLSEDIYKYKNIFWGNVDPYDPGDGSYAVVNGIKTVTIPGTVEVIQPATFSGMDDITDVTIPEKVTVIEQDTFLGCDRLATIQLPAGLKDLNISALTDCPKIKSIKFSSKNKVYKVKGRCLITKKEKALVYVMPGGEKLNIPDGVKHLKASAFRNCTARTVNIPASVTKIERAAFDGTKNRWNQNSKIKNVTVSKKNKVYAKDGQCIYNKKNNSLSVAIPNDKGELRISDKVKKLTMEYNMVNCDTYTNGNLKKVVLPKNLKSVLVPAFARLADADKVYFTGSKPPKIKKNEDSIHWAELPVFTNIYVPKNSEKAYKELYKEYKCYRDVKSWNTFNP